MQRTNSLLTHNVIGRITHGLIGLELFMNERKYNNYLKDFLTLSEEEIRAALLSSSAKMGLVQVANMPLSEEQTGLIQTVISVQETVKNADKIDPQKDIEPLISELGSKLDVVYRNLVH